MRQCKVLPVIGFWALCGGLPLFGQSEGGAVTSFGPDVIVGDLDGLHHWGASPDGAIHAYSVGTTSCNIGTQPLLWHQSDNQHPVIGQNMFRLKDGRFEQIGQSWLKWAFLALNESFCATCIDPGTGTLLGVNCSDPYSNTLNGAQSLLGPKSVVNPFTGAFPQNHATPPMNTIGGRLQVHTIDLDPNQNVGALYFLEGQYVSPDDAAAGNLYNNASYRQVWVTPGYGLTFNNPQGGTSSTKRQSPAITAWSTPDPLVAYTVIDVPGDGRLYLGFRSTLLAGGLWHYELALQNLDSDRAISGIHLPLPAGAAVSNIGFHDVDYHSGEPYNGDDWTATVTADGLHWDTTSFADDPNANALRWGTLYNFRFDADVSPPGVAQAELTLFKPGTPASLLITITKPRILLGDVNCDGHVDFADINPFVLILSDALAWQTAHPTCNWANGDTNSDGSVDFGDINPFVALLSAGG